MFAARQTWRSEIKVSASRRGFPAYFSQAAIQPVAIFSGACPIAGLRRTQVLGADRPACP
jgi:hypothetical protein